MSRLPVVLIAAASGLIVLGAACSDSSGPGKDLTFGTFAVALPSLNGVNGVCATQSFQFTVSSDVDGATFVAFPDSLAYGCSNYPNNISLYPLGVDKVADSLEISWTEDQTNQPKTLVLRWKPGTKDLYGTAVLDGTVTNGAMQVFWTGARQ